LSDVRLHYVEEGEGPAVILLHGFPDFWYSWRHQIPALAAAGYRVIAPDLRGFALSDKPYRVSDYSLDRLASDVAGLAAYLGESTATIVGHDWGGLVAWATAAWHPDLVERLVVMNAPHPDDYARGLRNPRQFKKSWYTGFFQLPGAAVVLERDGYAVLRRALRNSSLPGSFTDEDIERYVEAWSEPRAIRSQLSYYRAVMLPALARSRHDLGRGARNRCSIPGT
jgi:pimeloyl-ACP methyl ester carboxylesterase